MRKTILIDYNKFSIFSLSILMCDLYRGYKILPEFRTKVGVRLIHGCDLYTSNYGTSFSYSTVIYMYYTAEVTLLYPSVMLHLIKHANLLGGFPYHFK